MGFELGLSVQSLFSYPCLDRLFHSTQISCSPLGVYSLLSVTLQLWASAWLSGPLGHCMSAFSTSVWGQLLY